MKLFGFDITRQQKSLTPATSRGWFPLVQEPSAGAWQRSEPVTVETGLEHSAVFACVNVISSDLAKLPLRINRRTAGVWVEDPGHVYAGLFRRPNGYQTRLQFVQAWAASKLLHGNTYVLKQRDPLGRVEALHVLNPTKVTPLVSSETGEVFYQLKADDLAIIPDRTVPAREIIHDRGLCPFHSLLGVSPLTAAAMATRQGLAIVKQASKFFENGARPGSVLLAPGPVPNETADRLKAHWESNYSGSNAGRTAVLPDGIRYEAMSVNPVDAQLIEQLNWTAADIARAFSVPAYKIGAGAPPPYTGIEQIQMGYYSDCLQVHIESLELCLDLGLDLGTDEQTELDVTAMLRMDTPTRISTAAQAVTAGLLTTNEARRDLGLPPVEGGDQILRQMQDIPLGETTE